MREMKDSGLPWSTIIPQNWSVKRGKRVLNLMQREVRPDDEVVTCFRDGEVILRKLRRTDGFTISDKEIGYQGINVGDIVIHGMDGFAGAMGISKSQGKGTPVYVVCTPKEGNSASYIIYYLKSLANNNVFLALSTGIRERSCDLKWNKISTLQFICPPLNEQQRIATFLDEKCKEIDDLIALQEEMITELQAYKQSVITEAVTKGLNPNVSMKDSGVEWIGEIPEHWKICRLKNYTITHTDRVKNNTFLNYIGLENIISGSAKYIETDNKYDIDQAISCDKDYILFGKLRPYLAKVFIPSTSMCCSPEFAVFTFNGFSVFLKYLFLSDWFIKIVDASTYGAKMPRANINFICNMKIPYPPLSEQQAIADYLDSQCSHIDKLIALKRTKIEELQNYKKSVIYEYVTGKKEVPATV